MPENRMPTYTIPIHVPRILYTRSRALNVKRAFILIPETILIRSMGLFHTFSSALNFPFNMKFQL